MKFINITCDKTKHIVRAQEYLIGKYVGDRFEYLYLDLGKEDVNTWTHNVLKRLEGITDEYIVLSLDDFLPVDHFNHELFDKALKIMHYNNLNRFEIGWGASRRRDYTFHDYCGQEWREYGPKTGYSVSCQVSIWKLSKLKELLKQARTPWQFETRLTLNKVGCFREVIHMYICESALSGRQPNKINVLGLRPSDIDYLQQNDYFKYPLIYGWKGQEKYTEGLGGIKYNYLYE